MNLPVQIEEEENLNHVKHEKHFVNSPLTRIFTGLSMNNSFCMKYNLIFSGVFI